MVTKRFILCLVFLFAISFPLNSKAGSGSQSKSGHHDEVHWGYKGDGGPEHWGSLNPEYSLCSHGKSQSPIDFTKAYDTELAEIKFSYNTTPLKVINNGHTIQVNYAPGSNAQIDGQMFQLLQFHFHTHSEHTVNSKPYDMEMHLVHKNEKGELAVVGIFMKKGKENKVIQTIWDNIPHEINKEKVNPAVKINAHDLLPSDRSYYHYFGSLTTPPCSEGVNWSVMKTPIEVSDAQIKKFKSLMKLNARPTLPVNKRFILE